MDGPWEVGYRNEATERDVEADRGTEGAQFEKQTENRRASRTKTIRPQRYSDVGHLAFITAGAMCRNVTDLEPVSADESVNPPDSNEWITPMVDELKSLVENEVFSVVEKPEDRKIVDCLWVFALKKYSRGKIIRHIGRLVAKGFS